MKTHEWRKSGLLLALESDSGDMIAQGILDGIIETECIREEDITASSLMLVPCPFVIDCDGDDGQFACADCLDPPLASKSDAIRRGWRRVRFDPYAAGASYLGTCPRCQRMARVEVAK